MENKYRTCNAIGVRSRDLAHFYNRKWHGICLRVALVYSRRGRWTIMRVIHLFRDYGSGWIGSFLLDFVSCLRSHLCRPISHTPAQQIETKLYLYVHVRSSSFRVNISYLRKFILKYVSLFARTRYSVAIYKSCYLKKRERKKYYCY